MSISQDKFFPDLCTICLRANSKFTLSGDDKDKEYFKKTLDAMIAYIDIYVHKCVKHALEKNK